MSNSIEGKVFVTVAPWPVTFREVSVGDDGAVVDEIKTLCDGMLAVPLTHIVASGETLVTLAKRVAGPEAAERIRLEIEALEHDATPSDTKGADKDDCLGREPLSRSMRLISPYEPQSDRCAVLLGQAKIIAADVGADLQIGMMANRRGEVRKGWSYVVAAASDGALEEYGVFAHFWEDLLPALIESLLARKAERDAMKSTKGAGK